MLLASRQICPTTRRAPTTSIRKAAATKLRAARQHGSNSEGVETPISAWQVEARGTTAAACSLGDDCCRARTCQMASMRRCELSRARLQRYSSRALPLSLPPGAHGRTRVSRRVSRHVNIDRHFRMQVRVWVGARARQLSDGPPTEPPQPPRPIGCEGLPARSQIRHQLAVRQSTRSEALGRKSCTHTHPCRAKRTSQTWQRRRRGGRATAGFPHQS